MNYFLDCEFDGFGGRLMSLALVPEGRGLPALYLVSTELGIKDPWVRENVVPYLFPDNLPTNVEVHKCRLSQFPSHIAKFLAGDPRPHVISDWPDDIKYFCETLITGPGTMINIPSLIAQVIRIDAYPTKVEGAIRHCAYWDAVALREALT